MTMPAFEQLRRDASGFMQSSVLAALSELDFGTVLLENGNSCRAVQLADKCSCDRRGTEALLDALVGMGYFTKKIHGCEARYAVSDAYVAYLDSRHPDSAIPMMRHMACVMRDDRTSPVDGTLFGLNMLVNTPSGMVYTYEEIKEDLTLAGFTHVTHAVDVPNMCAVVTAKKPGETCK